MENWFTVIIVPIVIAILVNGTGFLLWRSQRDKTRAEAADVITDSSLKIVKRMERRVCELEVDMEQQRANSAAQAIQIVNLNRLVDDLRRGANRVIGQLVSLGHEPVWRPEESKEP